MSDKELIDLVKEYYGFTEDQAKVYLKGIYNKEKFGKTIKEYMNQQAKKSFEED